MSRSGLLLAVILTAVSFSMPADAKQRKALIVDGQNNHNWKDTTPMLKSYLEQTKVFEVVDVATTAAKGSDPEFKPDFSKYDVVVSNYNGAAWPKETQEAFVKYMKKGGGFVSVHAANNAFGDWPEYNRIIGLGGWGGRNEKHGPYVYLNDEGKEVRDDSKGSGGSHGSWHAYQIKIRDSKHPITKGLPELWMHANDELYDRMRGPAEDMKILATAFAEKSQGGTNRHEPIMMTIKYGKGRVFHTPMGHVGGKFDSQECVGFITVFQRGAEWAATGKVTQKVPEDFPGPDEVKKREFPGKPVK